MLQVSKMCDEYLFFYFVDGLQNWAKQELQRQGAGTVDEDIAIAESFTKYQRKRYAKDKEKNDSSSSAEEEMEVKKTHFMAKVYKEKSLSRSEYEEQKKTFVPNGVCYVCKGPHRAKDCSKPVSLFAVQEVHKALE